MCAVSVDTICIDVQDDEAQLCKWDGREIFVERVAGTDPCKVVELGIGRLGPRAGFRLRFRVRDGAAGAEETALGIEAMAQRAAAGAIRRLLLDIRTEPGLTAARQAADRHRLGEVVCLELRRSSFLCAVVDGRSSVGAHERGRRADADSVCPGVRRVGATAETLVCYGSASSEAVAVEIARRCGFRRVLIPDYASSLAVVGMLFVDHVFSLRADAPAGETDSRGIREAFARLMDEAARRVTREGYDIDDTICERLVELADETVVPFEGLAHPTSAVRGLRLRVTIQTPKFRLPQSPETDHLIAIGDE